jgi:hypothetical protein
MRLAREAISQRNYASFRTEFLSKLSENAAASV